MANDIIYKFLEKIKCDDATFEISDNQGIVGHVLYYEPESNDQSPFFILNKFGLNFKTIELIGNSEGEQVLRTYHISMKNDENFNIYF